MDFCDVCCPVGYFVLLFFVQRHALCLCAGLERNVNRQCIFCAREESRICQQSRVLLSKRVRMNNDHTARRSGIKPFNIIEPHVTLASVPGFQMDRAA